MATWEGILRLFFAMLIGGLLGFEREYNDRPAGLRTHMLVCMGSALVMLVSVELSMSFAGTLQSDPARIAAQVVSGIGFLGAGTILRDGVIVRGLTTAASLWVSAALGLAAGSGLYVYGLVATVFTLFALAFLSRLEKRMALKRNWVRGVLQAVDQPGLLGRVGSTLGGYGISITGIELRPMEETQVEIQLSLLFPGRVDLAQVAASLEALEPIQRVQLERNVPGSG